MFKRERPKDAIDFLASELARKSAMTELAIHEIASHISYRGVRTRITAGAANEGPCMWTAMLIVARRAIPALAILAAILFGWSATDSNAPTGFQPIDSAIRDGGGIGVQRVRSGGTCAISTSDRCSVSSEDVLATLVKETE
jgi:hypothetical protein